ncbi:glycosyltransferase family 4 protein [Psychrobacter celer]|uniref:glycosyltransferase family 4 protein n=1 Tax=Psychrobacter celer TaxID=306572 RepID=UPI003FD15164
MKYKSVLILCLNNSIGGVSTRMEGEVNGFIDQGVDVHILGDEQVKDCSYVKNPRVKSVIITELKACNTVEAIIRVLSQAESMIAKNGIDFIYSHHPDMYLISAIAAQRMKIPFMVTIHGIGFHLFNNPFQHFILKHFVYPYASLVTCMSPALTTISKFLVPDTNLRLYHNLVNTERFSPQAVEEVKVVTDGWLVVSRLGAEKIGGIVKLVEYAYRAGVSRVSIAGDGGPLLVERFKKLLSQAGISDFVTFLGPRKDIHSLMHQYSVVAGVDRVVLEAGSSMKPVCILGYNGGIKGFLTADNFKNLAYTNFCGRDLPDLSLQEFIEEVNNIDSINLEAIRNLILDSYSETHIWKQNVSEYISHLHYKENTYIQAMYDLMCFYELPIEGQVYSSPIFKKHVVGELLEYGGDKEVYKKYLKELENKQVFVHPHEYAIKAATIRVSDSVIDGDIIYSRDESVLVNDGVIVELDSYVKAPHGHRLHVTIRAMTYAKVHDENPMLMAVSFRNPMNGASLSKVNVSGLSLSSNKDIGYFEYIKLQSYMTDFVYEIEIKDGSEVSELRLVKWRPKPGENMLIESIKIQVFQ